METRRSESGNFRQGWVPKQFSSVFCGLPKPATRVFPHKRRSLRESWCRLSVFVAGGMFVQIRGQSWLLQVLATGMLTERGVLQKAAKGTKWDLVGNVGLRGFFGGKWWDAVSATG